MILYSTKFLLSCLLVLLSSFALMAFEATFLIGKIGILSIAAIIIFATLPAGGYAIENGLSTKKDEQ